VSYAHKGHILFHPFIFCRLLHSCRSPAAPDSWSDFVPFKTLDFRLLRADEDQPVLFGHFLHPWSVTLGPAPRELDMTIDFQVIFRHPYGLEAKGVFPVSVRIVVKYPVEDVHTVAI